MAEEIAVKHGKMTNMNKSYHCKCCYHNHLTIHHPHHYHDYLYQHYHYYDHDHHYDFYHIYYHDYRHPHCQCHHLYFNLGLACLLHEKPFQGINGSGE